MYYYLYKTQFSYFSVDFEKLISLEPYAGYNRTSFRVINEDELNQEFTFNKLYLLFCMRLKRLYIQPK